MVKVNGIESVNEIHGNDYYLFIENLKNKWMKKKEKEEKDRSLKRIGDDVSVLFIRCGFLFVWALRIMIPFLVIVLFEFVYSFTNLPF